MSLRDEILASGIDLSARDTQAIADQFSINRTKVGMVSRADFSLWAAATGARAKIEDHANNPASPLRSSALAIRDVLMGAAEGIDFSIPGNVALLDAWIAAGDIQQAQSDALIALATKPNPVTELEVRCALYSPTGEWLGGN